MNRLATLTLSGLLFSLTFSAIAGEAKVAYTDPAKAGPDFAVQGEYVGKIDRGYGEEPFGAQVIALGDGKFRAVGYPGGLPGDGWNGVDKLVAEGQRTEGVVELVPVREANEGGKAIVSDGLITAYDPEGAMRGKLERVVRKSETLGAEPPEGAVVLFDGTTAERFHDGRMTDDGLLMEGATSKRAFQSFTLHLEFRTPFQPFARGQGRGNSGFYAQGRYEVQILDSFGLEGEWNECGGIYGVARPKVNMCYPPLSWQTYDVDFRAAQYQDAQKVKNATMTVKHNGVLIHQDVEVPRATTAAPVPEGAESGPVFLQNHGNPVRFRNIWVVEK